MKLWFLLFLFLVNIIKAQDFTSPDHFDPLEDVSFAAETEYYDEYIQIKLKPQMPKSFHIGANQLFQLKLESSTNQNKLLKTITPDPIGPKDFPYFPHDAVFLCHIQYPSENEKQIRMTISYQVCSEGETALCFPPADKEILIKIDKSKFPAEENSSAVFSQENLGNTIQDMLKQGSFLVFFLVFFGGILTSLTPCVYPMIPITIGFIGARTENKKQGFKLSLFFTFGLSVTYAVLGLIAAQTGNVFGSFTQNPAVVITIASLFLIMGFSMFGLFELQLPSALISKLQSKKKQGLAGAVFMGMITGFIGAPCVGPVLISLLAFVATTGSMIKGFFLLLTFGLGMSVLFLIIGTFTGALKSMPSSGSWMNGVKYFFGVLLFGAALYFIHPFISKGTMFLLGGGLTVFAGICFYLSLNEENKAPLWRSLIILVISSGIVFWAAGLNNYFHFIETVHIPVGSQNLPEMKKDKIDWIINDGETAFQKAGEDNKIVLLDAYAEWCVACNELEEITYVNDAVKERLNDFILLKYDFTKKEDWQKEIKEKYQIIGLPTVVFLTADGKELSRFTGFLSPEDFLKKINSL